MRFCILVSALCILTSLGLGSDVGVDTILSPSGTVDSGQSIIPRMVISNTSSEPADSVNAYFIIDDGQPSPYADSITGFHLDALTTETLAFGGWVPRGRDSMTAIAWTECGGDTFPANDTFQQGFLVHVRDVAVIDLMLPDTIRRGDTVRLKALIGNFGSRAETLQVKFFPSPPDSLRRIPPFVWVVLPPGSSAWVTAPFVWVALPGIWVVGVSVILPGDLHPENNFKWDTIYVQSNILVDVDARAVLAPTGVIDTTQTITPRGRFGNNGSDAASFWAFFSIRNSGGAEMYAESSQAVLGPGDSTDIEYPSIRFSVLGNYTAICSTAMPGDQNSTNDVKKVSFRVVPSQAVEESPKPQAVSSKPEPTIVRGVLRLPVSLFTLHSSLFAMNGRKVMALRPGANDVTRLAPGVYFMRAEPMAAGPRPPAVRKVVIQH